MFSKDMLYLNSVTPSDTKIMINDYYIISREMESYLLSTIPSLACDYLFMKACDSPATKQYLDSKDVFKLKSFDDVQKFTFNKVMVNRAIYVKAIIESINNGVDKLTLIDSDEYESMDILPIVYKMVSFTLRASFTEKEFDILFSKGHIIPTKYKNFSVKEFYRYLSWYKQQELTPQNMPIYQVIKEIDFSKSYVEIEEHLTGVELH